ncbi:MAG TPA: DmsC/YnfH family molybdoenzyme membrane anchor subunit, partial [Verrucomicrobiae bacterium]
MTTLVDELLAEQRTLTAVERFSRHHDNHAPAPEEKFYRALMPARAPKPGEQYAFEVDLDACSGCKACVAGCHSLNGLAENETWREVGLLISAPKAKCNSEESCSCSGDHSPSDVLSLSLQQTITSACHHCVDPGCLNGCPVKAYDKDPETGIVRHLDDQCMGCQYCVMKCPYEVPKYSDKLGIVRKCDMCVNRLAVGEAPACVQSCPNGAIKIALVKKEETRAAYRDHGPSAAFLSDSPRPDITVPTTRYLSRRSLENLLAADHAAPRLDHPHWPLVIMLVFTQASVGVFLAATLAPATPLLLLVAFALMNIGLLAAPLHLGRPLKAWRAFLGWRTSWLSRELIAFNQFAPIAAAATALAWLPFAVAKVPRLGEVLAKLPAWVPPLEKFQLPLILVGAVVGLGCVAVSAMVYVDTKRACWSPRYSFGAFFGTTLLLGATFAAMVFAWLGELRLALPF